MSSNIVKRNPQQLKNRCREVCVDKYKLKGGIYKYLHNTILNWIYFLYARWRKGGKVQNINDIVNF